MINQYEAIFEQTHPLVVNRYWYTLVALIRSWKTMKEGDEPKQFELKLDIGRPFVATKTSWIIPDDSIQFIQDKVAEICIDCGGLSFRLKWFAMDGGKYSPTFEEVRKHTHYEGILLPKDHGVLNYIRVQTPEHFRGLFEQTFLNNGETKTSGEG